MTTALEELEKLSVPEKVQIVEDLWDSIARSNAEIPMPQWQKDELDRRKQDALKKSEPYVTWEDAKRDILKSR
jgi:putative addiction module component (TIGR02574 family)